MASKGSASGTLTVAPSGGGAALQSITLSPETAEFNEFARILQTIAQNTTATIDMHGVTTASILYWKSTKKSDTTVQQSIVVELNTTVTLPASTFGLIIAKENAAITSIKIGTQATAGDTEVELLIGGD